MPNLITEQITAMTNLNTLYYWIEIVNRSNNVFMLLTDVLISIFQIVEFVDRKVSDFSIIYVIVCLAYKFVLIIMEKTGNCDSGIICSFSWVFKCFRSKIFTSSQLRRHFC